MTLTTGQDDQVTEFRVGTVNDLLLAAKGGTTDSAADAKRFKSLALAGGVCSAVLALALVAVLITGTGSKSSAKSGAKTAATVKPLPLPLDTGSGTVVIPNAQADSVVQGSYVNITGHSYADPNQEIKILNALVIAVRTDTKPGATKDSPPTVTTTAQVAIPNSQQSALAAMDPKTQRIFVTSGPAASTTTTATPATQPPAIQPATPPSS